jgi:hypothetical protein
VVHLASVEGTLSRVSGGFPGIVSVFVIVGVALGQSLPIYGCHRWRWLLLWCTDSYLGPYHDDFPSVYYNKLFPCFGDGGARTAACVRLALVFIVIAR